MFGETFGIDDLQMGFGRGYHAIGIISACPLINNMEAFFISVLTVAIGEVGDKTQLLALLLAAKFKKPIPIILGILCATIANHAAAGSLGAWISHNIGHSTLSWILGISFIAMSIWTLKPDTMDDEIKKILKYGAFITTLVTFFLAEIGDKTQIATMALAMKYNNLFLVIAGTTIGMLIADVPAVIIGHKSSEKIPLKIFRIFAAIIFLVLGIFAILGKDSIF